MLQAKEGPSDPRSDAEQQYEKLREEDSVNDLLEDLNDTAVDQAAQISEMQDYLEAAMGVKFKLKGVRKLGQ